MKLIFATWANAEYQGRILTELGANNRLISFWELRELDADLIDNYQRDGKAGKRKASK